MMSMYSSRSWSRALFLALPALLLVALGAAATEAPVSREAAGAGSAASTVEPPSTAPSALIESLEQPILLAQRNDATSWGDDPCTTPNYYYKCFLSFGCGPGYSCAYRCSSATGECCMVPPFYCVDENFCFE
jgi:hypothetical protein